MARFLIFIAVCTAIYFLWAHIQKISKRPVSSEPKQDIEPMVKCNYCQVYTTKKSSIKGNDGQWYCCLTHEQQVGK